MKYRSVSKEASQRFLFDNRRVSRKTSSSLWLERAKGVHVETVDAGIDIRLAKALSHPVRAKALEILNDRVASPSDIATELELPVANVSYHVHTLHRLGCVEEVETRHVRGAIEHLYRAVRRPWARFEQVKEMPTNARQQWFADIAAMAFADARWAVEADVLGERADNHASWTRLRLDPEGWQQVYDVLDEALQRCIEIHEESVERLDNGPANTHETRAMLSMFFYESPPR